jgi:hypothetical protein
MMNMCPTSCISPIFSVLVDVVKEHGGNAAQALRSNIMSVLEQRDPLVYKRAGVTGFKKYMKLAMNAGVIMEGGKAPLRWVSLLPSVQDADFLALAPTTSKPVLPSLACSNLLPPAPTFPLQEIHTAASSLTDAPTDSFVDLGQTCSLESAPERENDCPTALCPEQLLVNVNPPCIPSEFVALVQVIKEHHGGKVQVLYKMIKDTILQRDALVYKKIGVEKFKQYVSLAVQAGVVIAGGVSDGRWMCLHPSYHTTNVAAPRLYQLTSAPVEPCSPEISSPICNSQPEISGEGVPSNAPTVSPEITLIAISDAAQQTHSNSRPGAVPYEFAPLVEVLSELEGEGSILRFLRERVRVVLVARDPQAFGRAGVKKFKAYLRLAVAANLVKLEGNGDGMWISLHPRLRYIL